MTLQRSRKRSFLVFKFFLLAYNNAPCHSWVQPPSIVRTRSTHATKNVDAPNQPREGSIMRVSDATNYGNEADGSVDYEYDDAEAKSQFGTKEYWDEQYQGRGDFPMDEYQWYFGFEQYGKYVQSYAPSKDKEILIPGIGNDPILLDLLQKGYTKLTATDYSEFAIERQIDFLAHGRYPFFTNLHSEEDGTSMQQCSDDEGQRPTELLHMDARKMPAQWANKFDAIVEKGALDAIYLSGNGNVELAAREFERILKPGGILITVSGVVPVDLRKEIFRDWTWIRDGSEDLKAGCFILEKPIS